MTLHALVDDVDYGQVATVKGWSDFFDWADLQKYHELAHIVHHGYATRLLELAECIDSALEESPAPPDVESVARGIEEICRANPDADILIISDGVGDSTDDDDDDDDDDDGGYEPFDDEPPSLATPKVESPKKRPTKKATKSTKPRKKTTSSEKPPRKSVQPSVKVVKVTKPPKKSK
jgi:hypothetical protein